MSATTLKPSLLCPSSEPAWDIATLFPAQGAWCEAEYLSLNGNRLVELSNGCVEVLTMPTMLHQLLVAFLYEAVKGFVTPSHMGMVLFSPLRIRLWEGKMREPDVVFMMTEHMDRAGNEFWEGADLVMEVVSNDDRRRDLQTKRFEYARAGIPEYWIVDPDLQRITVLKLDGNHYQVHGEFTAGQRATSVLLAGFGIEVDAAFAAARR